MSSNNIQFITTWDKEKQQICTIEELELGNLGLFCLLEKWLEWLIDQIVDSFSIVPLINWLNWIVSAPKDMEI